MECAPEDRARRSRRREAGAGRGKGPEELDRETLLSQKSTQVPSALGGHQVAGFDDVGSSSTWQEARVDEEDASCALKDLRLPGQPLMEDWDELMDEDRGKGVEAQEPQGSTPRCGASPTDGGAGRREGASHSGIAAEGSAEHTDECSSLAQVSHCSSDHIYLFDKTPSLSRCSSEEEIVEGRARLEAETGRVSCVRDLTRLFPRGDRHSKEDFARAITSEEVYEKLHTAAAESGSGGEGRAVAPPLLAEPSLPRAFFENGDLPHFADDEEDDDDELDDYSDHALTTASSLLRDDSFSDSLDDESWEAAALEGIVPNSPPGSSKQSSSSPGTGPGRSDPAKVGGTRGPRAVLGSLMNRASRMLRRQKAHD